MKTSNLKSVSLTTHVLYNTKEKKHIKEKKTEPVVQYLSDKIKVGFM